MAIPSEIRKKIEFLKRDYDALRKGKSSLLGILFEAEIPESVYNSNAIENSTLTIAETEKILMELEVSRDVSVREVFEAKNLARVSEYTREKAEKDELTIELILLLHQMLLGNIDESIAGRFRKKGEYVRVGTHIAPAPEHVAAMLESSLLDYNSELDKYFLERISRFHLEFEHVHPFNDGNGRIGRVITNYQLMRDGFPPIIIRDKEKMTYYKSFQEYKDKKRTVKMDKVFYLALLESLHKRVAYLKGQNIVTIVEYSKKKRKPLNGLLNKAKRQTIPAFREKGVWKIGI